MHPGIFPLFLRKCDSENTSLGTTNLHKSYWALVVASNVCGESWHAQEGYSLGGVRRNGGSKGARGFPLFLLFPLTLLFLLTLSLQTTMCVCYTALHVPPLQKFHFLRLSAAGTLGRFRPALQRPDLRALLSRDICEPRSASVPRCSVSYDHRSLAAHHLVEDAPLEKALGTEIDVFCGVLQLENPHIL